MRGANFDQVAMMSFKTEVKGIALKVNSVRGEETAPANNDNAMKAKFSGHVNSNRSMKTILGYVGIIAACLLAVIIIVAILYRIAKNRKNK